MFYKIACVPPFALNKCAAYVKHTTVLFLDEMCPYWRTVKSVPYHLRIRSSAIVESRKMITSGTLIYVPIKTEESHWQTGIPQIINPKTEAKTNCELSIISKHERKCGGHLNVWYYFLGTDNDTGIFWNGIYRYILKRVSVRFQYRAPVSNPTHNV